MLYKMNIIYPHTFHIAISIFMQYRIYVRKFTLKPNVYITLNQYEMFNLKNIKLNEYACNITFLYSKMNMDYMCIS